MKICTNRPMAQGDVLFVPVDSIPADAKPAMVENGFYIIAHSETGHHHVIDRARADVYEAADDTFVSYIRALGGGAEIVHKRSFDTHPTIGFEPNKTYKAFRQREHVAEGFRRAQD